MGTADVMVIQGALRGTNMTLRKFEPTHPCCGGCVKCQGGGATQYTIVVSGIGDWIIGDPARPNCFSGACEGLNGNYVVGPDQEYTWDYDSVMRCMWLKSNARSFNCSGTAQELDARLIVGRNLNDGYSDPTYWYVAFQVFTLRWSAVIPNDGKTLLDCDFDSLILSWETNFDDNMGCVEEGSTAVVSVYTPPQQTDLVATTARSMASPHLTKFLADRKATPTRKRCCGGFHPTPADIRKKLR